jgi:hypothetical protein
MDTLRLLLRLLLRLEEASAETAGILPVRLRNKEAGGGETTGMIMAEGARICWASSPRITRRLSDLLLATSGISKEQIEKVFQFCRRTGKPLGEHMVSLGILTQDQLREALLSHTISAFLALGHLIRSGEASPEPFQRNQERSYNPTFRFSALELVLEMIRREPELGVALGHRPKTFGRWGSKVRQAICFRETDWDDIPGIPVGCQSNRIDMSLAEALQIFRHGQSLVEPPGLAAAAVHPYSIVIRNGTHGWLASHIAPHLCLYEVDSPGEMGSILSSILRDRHDGPTGG